MDSNDVQSHLDANDDASVYDDPRWGLKKDAPAYQALLANKSVIALTAAAVLSLAVASAAAIAAFSGTNYTAPASGTDCATFHFTSVSDPVTTSTFAGRQIAQGENQESLKNFSTVYNTIGGPTVISTKVGLSPASGYFDNREVTLTHGSWNVSAITVDHTDAQGNLINWGATVDTVVTENGVAHAIALDKSYTTADGSVISYDRAGVHVRQPLASGGTLTTHVTETQNPQYVSFMNIDQSANAAAVVSGDAVALASGDTSAVLALSCGARTDAAPVPPILTTPAPPPPAGPPPNSPVQNNVQAGLAM